VGVAVSLVDSGAIGYGKENAGKENARKILYFCFMRGGPGEEKLGIQSYLFNEKGGRRG